MQKLSEFIIYQGAEKMVHY